MKKIVLRFHQLLIIIKYLVLYSVNCILCHNPKYDVWLISERGTEARDNAYCFYRYMKEQHKNQKILYVIEKNSCDLSKIDKNDVLIKGSIEHYFFYMRAKVLISTHIMGYSPDMRVFTKFNKFKIFKPNGKQVFLQHGIINNYLKELSSNNVDIDIFISGAYKEYEYLLKNFGYTEKTIKYTGLARYDNLIDKSRNQILLMPTWRKYLFHTSSDKKFSQSEYFQNINRILNDKKLLDFLEKNNCYLYFYPHYEIQKYINSFNSNSKRVIIAKQENYSVQKLLKESKLLITDYSSVFYDFAYMKKPIIYYQFDYNKFYSKHYEKGYFDFEKDGFGPVIYDYDKLIDNIISSYYQENQEFYNQRSKEFFRYRDQKNCERIYNEIKKII